MMVDASTPITRFAVIDFAEGCRNCVFSPALTEKLSQSITARSVPCVIVTTDVPSPDISASPSTTAPPSGFASAGRLSKLAARTLVLARASQWDFDLLFLAT